MVKFIFKIREKGWLAGLGLHHALVALIPLAVGLLVSYLGQREIGAFIASGGLWFYLGREYKEHELRRGGFELLDFVSPAIVALSYLPIIAVILD